MVVEWGRRVWVSVVFVRIPKRSLENRKMVGQQECQITCEPKLVDWLQYRL